MKFAALACVVAVASAIETTDETLAASFVQMVNTDEWCHEHHLGSGASGCIEHNGCCFSNHVDDYDTFDFSKNDLGPCHSCDAHQDEWCEMFGVDRLPSDGDKTDECLALGGCTYDSETDECISAKPEIKSTVRLCIDDANDADARSAYKICMDNIDEEFGHSKVGEGRDADGNEIWQNTVANGGCAELYYYEPSCEIEGDGKFFAASQADEDGIGAATYFCVDKYGHEIPDTRKGRPLDEFKIDCEKQRDFHNGLQCPNAMTLTTKGGFVIVNEMNDAKDCSVTCNTDGDCAGEGHWCCFNGCGYSCHAPVKPLSGCHGVPGDEFQTVLPAGKWEKECPPGKGGDDCSRVVEEDHGSQILLACKDGFDVVPIETAVQDIALKCRHGHWETMSGDRDFVDDLVCDKACDPYVIDGDSAIDGRALRERDFHVEGHGFVHGSTVELSCPYEYGVVAGTKKVRAESSEQMTCKQGTWGNAEGNPQSIECSVCYDKYDFEWRDDRDNACLYYATRPMECNDNPDAVDNCRVSCRSCLQAEESFKHKNTIQNLDLVPEEKKSNWERIRTRVQVEKTRTTYKSVNTVVTSYLPASEVCTHKLQIKPNIRMPADGCPPGFTPMGQSE